MEAANRPRKPRRRWRWHVPPALLHGGESLEGVQVLDEVEGPLGLLLWETYRDVVLWGATPQEDRAGLFARGAHAGRLRAIEAGAADPEIAGPLRAAAGVLTDPEGAEELEVMAACREIADWAEARRLLATAVTLATAAAVAAPAHAGTAFRVGQVARSRGEGNRAETWFRRAIGLGRQARDWTSYSEAFLGLGSLYQQRGDLRAARRLHVRGLRAARRHALRDVQARALHALFRIAAETGPPAEAQELAREAYRAYGSRRARLPALAADVAGFWMSQGRFGPALEVFRAVLPRLDGEGERLRCAAGLARAAGSTGDRTAFEDAWETVWESHRSWEGIPTAAGALLELALGASALRDWGRAERAAEAARDLAERGGIGQVSSEAERVLEATRRKRSVPPPAAASGDGDAVEELRAEIVRTLGGRGGA